MNVLINMGIKSIFNEKTADLSKMTESNSKDLYIGSIKQKSYIEVNEKGTKASAATIATVDENSANVPIDIEFDKPFIYIIKQSNSDDILFFGVVYTPTLANNETNFCN